MEGKVSEIEVNPKEVFRLSNWEKRAKEQARCPCSGLGQPPGPALGIMGC